MCDSKDEARLKKTIELAGTSNYTKHDGTPIPMGAKIYNKKICIAEGTNSNKSHPLQVKYNRENDLDYKIRNYLHAEMQAIVRCSKTGITDFSDCTIYIARLINSGNGIGLARPCKACRAAIKELGIKRIVYTTYDGYTVEYITEED